MVKRLFYSVLLYSFFTMPMSAILHASLHVEPCHFGLRGELLYLKPSTNTTSFATAIDDTTLTNYVNDPKYSPGFRLEGQYALDCLNHLHARFTYFNSGDNKRSVTDTFLSPIGFTGTVEDNVKYRYYALEFLFGRWLFDECDFDLEIEAGVHYGNIRFDDFVRVTSGAEERDGVTHSKFWGVGPEVAIGFHYPFPFCPLAFAFDAREALLISKTDASIFGADGFNVLTEPFFGVVPASDLRLGLNWGSQCSCIRFELEAGYEWIYYHRAFIQGDTPNNISFNGPYFALDLTY